MRKTRFFQHLYATGRFFSLLLKKEKIKDKIVGFRTVLVMNYPLYSEAIQTTY